MIEPSHFLFAEPELTKDSLRILSRPGGERPDLPGGFRELNPYSYVSYSPFRRVFHLPHHLAMQYLRIGSYFVDTVPFPYGSIRVHQEIKPFVTCPCEESLFKSRSDLFRLLHIRMKRDEVLTP